MTYQPTLKQTLLIWCLLAKQGSAMRAEIIPKPEVADRKALEAAGILRVTKISRSLFFKLEDEGWRWASEHLRDDLPPQHRSLQDMMIRLHNNLIATDKVLADFIGSAPEAKDFHPIAPKPSASLKAIKTAYKNASGHQMSVRVLLSDLRKQMPNVARTKLDEALKRAHLSGKVTLMHLDNPAEITPAVQAAQIDFKGDPLHMIWIEK